MKTTLATLLAASALTCTAAADPLLLVQTTLSERDAKGETKLLSKPNVIVESGKPATIQFGKLEYTLTPTLLADGTVEIQTVITERNGQKTDKLAAPRIIVQLGKVAEVQCGKLAFTAQPSLAKQP